MKSWVTRGFAALILVLISLPAFAERWESFLPVQQLLDGRTPKTEGLNLDLPLVSEDGSAVPLAISFSGQLQAGDRLQSLRVFATANPNPEVIDFRFADERLLPDLATRIRLNETQTVIAVAETSQGQVWVAAKEVRVTVSGCLMASEQQGEPAMQTPRVALPRRMSAGRPLEVRTLVNHPMETGLRETGDGERAPQALVESLSLYLDGEQAWQARFYTGTAANPYVRLKLQLPKPAAAAWVWRDQQGQEVSQERKLEVR